MDCRDSTHRERYQSAGHNRKKLTKRKSFESRSIACIRHVVEKYGIEKLARHNQHKNGFLDFRNSHDPLNIAESDKRKWNSEKASLIVLDPVNRGKHVNLGAVSSEICLVTYILSAD